MGPVSRRRFLRDGAAATLGLGLGLGARTWSASPGLAQTDPGASALEDLRVRLDGTLMLPDDSGYLAASAPANGRYLDIRPAAVARVAHEDDVVTCVEWCLEHGISPVARGGGHSYAGFSTGPGLMLDLRRLNSVTVDRRAGIAVTGGAALNRDLFVALEDGPLFLPGGTCLGVGIGGLTLGGGIGYNTHWAGLTSDHLVASRLVIAAAEALELDASRHRDLLWACRGGAGGSFGVNTQFTFELVEAPAEVAYYRFEYRGADAAAAVLAAFDGLIGTAPPALNAVAMAQAAPVGEGGPREAIDVMTRGQYVGPIDELRDLVSPLLAAARPTRRTLEAMSFWDMQRLIATDEPESHSFGDISRYAGAPIPEAVTAAMVDLLARCPSRSEVANGSIWSLGWVGGELMNAIPRTETAYVHRGVTTLLRPTTVWPNDAPPSVGRDLDAWTDEVIALLTPDTLAESYQNFPNRRIADWAQLYYAENLDRLMDVKTAYDPGDLFHYPQSIPART